MSLTAGICPPHLLKKKTMNSILLLACLGVIISCTSCKKDSTDKGIPTVIKGHVEDPIRGINISGYKVGLIRDQGIGYGGLFGMPGSRFVKVAEAYTDSNGDYFISFLYYPELDQQYHLEEQYYGNPYYHESTSGSGRFIGGATNVVNMTAWKPIELKLNVQLLNNTIPPLNIRNELAATHETLFNVESLFQQNMIGTFILRSRPDSDINIIFYYTINNTSSTSVTHEKIIPYHTTLDSTTTLNYTIDCSTF